MVLSVSALCVFDIPDIDAVPFKTIAPKSSRVSVGLICVAENRSQPLSFATMVVCIIRLGNYTGRWADTEQGKPIVVVGRFARTIKRKQLLNLRCRMQTAGLFSNCGCWQIALLVPRPQTRVARSQI